LGHVNTETKFGVIKVDESTPTDTKTQMTSLVTMYSVGTGY